MHSPLLPPPPDRRLPPPCPLPSRQHQLCPRSLRAAGAFPVVPHHWPGHGAAPDFGRHLRPPGTAGARSAAGAQPARATRGGQVYVSFAGRPCAVQPPAGATGPALPRTGLCGLQGGQAWGLWLRVRMAGTAGWHGMQRSALGSAWAGSGPAAAAHQLLVTTGRQLWVVCSRCRLVGACLVAHRPMLAAASVIKPLSASPRCRCCMEWTTPQTNEQRSTARCVPHC